MARWGKLILAGLGSVGVGVGLAVWVGSARWNAKTSQLVGKLIEAIPRSGAETISFEGFGPLPAPVAQYFRRVLREGRPMVRSVRMIQAGEFRARRVDDGWSRFEAQEYFSARPPGFVWDAGIRMVPFMKAHTRDVYLAGQGSMEAKILSLITVVDERSKAELNAGALQRYLAEAVWFPTALLPSERVRWSPIDSRRALATLTDSGATASLEFRFNDVGEVVSVFTPGRYRAVNGKYERTPWEGRFRNYEEREGMRIPIEGEVEWRLQDGSFPYWRGKIVEVKYDFAR